MPGRMVQIAAGQGDCKHRKRYAGAMVECNQSEVFKQCMYYRARQWAHRCIGGNKDTVEPRLACHWTPSRTGTFDTRAPVCTTFSPQLPATLPSLPFSLAPSDRVLYRDFVICIPFIYSTCLCTRLSNIGTLHIGGY